MKSLRTLTIAFLFAILGTHSASAGPAASAEYDVSATYEFRKTLTDSGPAFSGDTAWNVCTDKWRDYLPDCEDSFDCQDMHEEDPSVGLACWNGGCTAKGHYVTALAMCGARWDNRDKASDPDWGTSYGLSVTMNSEGSAGVGGSKHNKSVIKTVMDLTAHVFGFDITMGELHLRVKNERGKATKISAWYEGLLGKKKAQRTWTIDGHGADESAARDISKEYDKDIEKCLGINLVVVKVQACAEVRAVFRMDATAESTSGAGVTINAIPTLAVEADVTVKAAAGIEALSTAAKVEGGGTLQLAALQFPLQAEINGPDGSVKAGFVAQGLAGSIWAKVDGFKGTIWANTLWDFGDTPIEDPDVTMYLSPENPLINLIWDEDSVF
jgi:hypothetical protein